MTEKDKIGQRQNKYRCTSTGLALSQQNQAQSNIVGLVPDRQDQRTEPTMPTAIQTHTIPHETTQQSCTIPCNMIHQSQTT